MTIWHKVNKVSQSKKWAFLEEQDVISPPEVQSNETNP